MEQEGTKVSYRTECDYNDITCWTVCLELLSRLEHSQVVKAWDYFSFEVYVIATWASITTGRITLISEV